MINLTDESVESDFWSSFERVDLFENDLLKMFTNWLEIFRLMSLLIGKFLDQLLKGIEEELVCKFLRFKDGIMELIRCGLFPEDEETVCILFLGFMKGRNWYLFIEFVICNNGLVGIGSTEVIVFCMGFKWLCYQFMDQSINVISLFTKRFV